ncbi:MAG: hypothetical protein EP303_02895 [Deltaproteobacteria bacterium]|nr:MAG: hypothetical protein EP303_02895 [Deltaproteobacteria bacterium]
MVSWLETALSTTTDAWGRFSLELPMGNLFLQTSKAGTWGEIKLVGTRRASKPLVLWGRFQNGQRRPDCRT